MKPNSAGPQCQSGSGTRRAFPPGVTGSRTEGQQGWGPQNRLPPKAPVSPPEMSRLLCSWHLVESLMKQAASSAPSSAALCSQWAAIHTTSRVCLELPGTADASQGPAYPSLLPALAPSSQSLRKDPILGPSCAGGVGKRVFR